MKLSRLRRYLITAILSFLLIPAAQAQIATAVDPQNTEQVNPSNKSNDLYYNAVKAEILGDDSVAASLFQEFSEDNPNEPASYFELSKISEHERKPDEAESYIKKAVALDGTNKWYKDLYASILADRDEYGDAADIMNEIAESDPDNSSYLLNAALLYEHAQNYKKAIALLNEVISKTGPDEDLLLQKQRIFLKMNEPDSAENAVEELVDLNPKEGKYYIILGELYDDNKEPQKAVEVYERGQRIIPNDPSLQLGLAEHYRKTNDTARYIEYAKKVITNKDLDAETQLSLLDPYIQDLTSDSAKKTEALQLVSQLAAQHPKDPRVLGVYGQILQLNNEKDKATEIYKRALAIDPSHFMIWGKLLDNYTDREDADSLVKYSEKAIRYFPDQALLYYYEGIGEMNRKSYPQAITAINRSIDMQTDDSLQLIGQLYSTLGELYNTTKQYDLSDSAFKKAIDATELEHGNENFLASVLNNYAYYLSERGVRLDEAERMSKRSLEIRPTEATFLDTYGWILYKSGKYSEAKEYIQKAIDADPKNADATLYDHLGNAYYKSGDVNHAVECWEKAKEKGDDDPNIEKKIQDRKLYE